MNTTSTPASTFAAISTRAAEQITSAVDELIDWADVNRDRVVADLAKARTALESRLAPHAPVTKADLADLEARISAVEAAADQALTTARKATAKKPAARKPAAKKSAAKPAAAAEPAGTREG